MKAATLKSRELSGWLLSDAREPTRSLSCLSSLVQPTGSGGSWPRSDEGCCSWPSGRGVTFCTVCQWHEALCAQSEGRCCQWRWWSRLAWPPLQASQDEPLWAKHLAAGLPAAGWSGYHLSSAHHSARVWQRLSPRQTLSDLVFYTNTLTAHKLRRPVT